jgi:hypothetical protein
MDLNFLHTQKREDVNSSIKKSIGVEMFLMDLGTAAYGMTMTRRSQMDNRSMQFLKAKEIKSGTFVLWNPDTRRIVLSGPLRLSLCWY